jgi:hypothetical protein
MSRSRSILLNGTNVRSSNRVQYRDIEPRIHHSFLDSYMASSLRMYSGPPSSSIVDGSTSLKLSIIPLIENLKDSDSARDGAERLAFGTAQLLCQVQGISSLILLC